MPHDSSTDEMSLTAVFKSDSALCACANKHKQIGRSIGNHQNCCAAYHFVGRRSPTRTQGTPELRMRNRQQDTSAKKNSHCTDTRKDVQGACMSWMHTDARVHTTYIHLIWLPVKDANTIRTCPVSLLHRFNLVGSVWNTDY